MIKLLTFFIGLLLSSHVLAHVGHDHSDAMSGLIHVIWVAPLLVGLVILSIHVKFKLAKKRNSK